jgi:hypothetical protein
MSLPSSAFPPPGTLRATLARLPGYPLVTFSDSTFATVLPRWHSCRRSASSAVPVRSLAAASPRPPTCSRFLPDGEQALRRGRCHDRAAETLRQRLHGRVHFPPASLADYSSARFACPPSREDLRAGFPCALGHPWLVTLAPANWGPVFFQNSRRSGGEQLRTFLGTFSTDALRVAPKLSIRLPSRCFLMRHPHA